MTEENRCADCKWHDDFSWACCNGESAYRAEFTDEDFYCAKYERKNNNEISADKH